MENKTENIDESLIDYRVLLIGDAGEPSPEFREPVLDAMEKRASLLPQKTINIFLGDNVYPFGLESEDDLFYEIACSRLQEQIKVMQNSNTGGIFIPGNHDWGNGDFYGWDRIKRMCVYIDKNNPSVEMLPKNGCPGPVVRDYGNKLRIIILDTEWWLRDENKPDSSNSDCNPITEDEIINSVDSLIKTSEDRFVLIAGHHPLETYGPHGGFFDWKSHLFPLLDFNDDLWIPLPVIGSIYPLARIAGISPQDMSNSLYQNFIERIEAVVYKYNNVIYSAGHEHSLQVIQGVNKNVYLVSGYGTASHHNNLSYGDKSIFSVLQPGFIQLDLLKDNRIRLTVFTINENGTCEESFSSFLFDDKVITEK
ncbi:MAG TPA: metallophosphoesterase [Ignavibacteriaceae bacterium]|nr:metallophosphoesterase [Ignavibacteriaceae bacterium]